MRSRRVLTTGLGVVALAGAVVLSSGCWKSPTQPCAATPTCSLTPRIPLCSWGATAPLVGPNSTQVMMMPIVMDFATVSSTQIAFVSFEDQSQISRDGGGVLRVVDGNCHLIASFPDPSVAILLPPNCPSDLNVRPQLASGSGLAAANVDSQSDIEIIGLLDDPNGTTNHFQVVAFNLVGPIPGAHLVPKWCSAPLPANDPILGTSAPAIAHLDQTGSLSNIIVDNKVFTGVGVLRYTGAGGPRSRTAVVANVLGASLPQMITGRGLYTGGTGSWTGTLGWTNVAIDSGNGGLAYPAVAELDPNSPGPEIVVTDTMAATLSVLSSATGATLASIPLPNPNPNPNNSSCPFNAKCGGPPMLATLPSLGGTVIGVASCSLYTLFRYRPTPPALQVIWSMPINDASGQTTSTLYSRPQGATTIYYADAETLWWFNAVTGAVVGCAPNTSGTAIEGPIIASFDNTGLATGRIIVAANNYLSPGAGQKGIRIFSDPVIGPALSFWNQHTLHRTNVVSSMGAIPLVEPPSWVGSSPARNSYRVNWP